MPKHNINLSRAWQIVGSAEKTKFDLPDMSRFHGGVVAGRRFNRPTGLALSSVVNLAFDRLPESIRIEMNGVVLAAVGQKPSCFEVTKLLESHNQVQLIWDGVGGAPSFVQLEILQVDDIGIAKK